MIQQSHEDSRMDRIGIMLVAFLVCIAPLGAGCGHSTIALDAGVVLPAGARSPDPLMDVTGTVSGGRDPLPVDGARYAFSNLTTTMTEMMAAAARPWAARHAKKRRAGWQLTIDLVDAQAELRGGVLRAEIEIRATLLSRDGLVALGQSQRHCTVTGVDSHDPPSVVYRCLEQLARDLAGWLETAHP
jgi:hypothetical protein